MATEVSDLGAPGRCDVASWQAGDLDLPANSCSAVGMHKSKDCSGQVFWEMTLPSARL